MIVDQIESVEVMISEVQEEIEDKKPWFYDLKNLLEGQSFPEFSTLEDKRRTSRYAVKYTVLGGLLYQKTFDGILLHCLDDTKTWMIIE